MSAPILLNELPLTNLRRILRDAVPVSRRSKIQDFAFFAGFVRESTLALDPAAVRMCEFQIAWYKSIVAVCAKSRNEDKYANWRKIRFSDANAAGMYAISILDGARTTGTYLGYLKPYRSVLAPGLLIPMNSTDLRYYTRDGNLSYMTLRIGRDMTDLALRFALATTEGRTF